MRYPLNPTAFDELMVDVGRNVVKARHALGLKQSELAVETGLKRSTIGKIESFNATDVSMRTLLALSDAFEIPAYVLMLSRQDWEKLESITSLPDLIRGCKLNIGPEKVEQLKRKGRSESINEQVEAARESQQIAEGIFGEVSRYSVAGRDVDEERKKVLGKSREVAAALGSSMLPDHPVLNVLIAEKIAVPYEKLISKSTRRT